MNLDKVWYLQGDISPITAIKPEKIACFATETTGFNAFDNDEMLQLTIIDGNKTVLFNSYLRPEKRRRWSKAAPETKEQIQKVFDNADLIVGYNLPLGIKFLQAAGIKFKDTVLTFDVMREFPPVDGKSELAQCAEHYNYKFETQNALENAKAALHCFYAMLRDNRTVPYKGYLQLVKENRFAKKKTKFSIRKGLIIISISSLLMVISAIILPSAEAFAIAMLIVIAMAIFAVINIIGSIITK